MTPLRQWLSVWLEWLLLGIGLGCLGTYAYETVEARRFQAKQAVEFARSAQAYAPVTVRTGGLVGMLDVPRLKLTHAGHRRRRRPDAEARRRTPA